jgi:hypothetical protein
VVDPGVGGKDFAAGVEASPWVSSKRGDAEFAEKNAEF